MTWWLNDCTPAPEIKNPRQKHRLHTRVGDWVIFFCCKTYKKVAQKFANHKENSYLCIAFKNAMQACWNADFWRKEKTTTKGRRRGTGLPSKHNTLWWPSACAWAPMERKNVTRYVCLRHWGRLAIKHPNNLAICTLLRTFAHKYILYIQLW